MSMLAERKRLLILCKTYPSPSAKHVETSCVAGLDESDRLVRLYPVPFRLIADEQQFRKWQWISARVRKASEDHRVESHRISVDTIEVHGEPLSTNNAWAERRHAIERVDVFEDFESLDEARLRRGVTLALLRPSKLVRLQFSKADSPDWTDEEVAKLMQSQAQGWLFDQDAEQRSLRLLRKIPFDFHYHYECRVGDATRAYRHKLVDWEAGALYWNVHRRSDWQEAFQQRFLNEFAEKNVLFLMGTMHRFPHQWLIVSVIYPPKPHDELAGQQRLF
jgi:hypothetical protein